MKRRFRVNLVVEIEDDGRTKLQELVARELRQHVQMLNSHQLPAVGSEGSVSWAAYYVGGKYGS